MRVHTPVLAALLLSSVCVHAQSTGMQATPQTRNAAPAGSTAPSPASTAQAGGQRQRGRAGRTSTSRGGSNASAQGSPAPAATASVGVIGDSNGDGILDRSGKSTDSAALPGVATLHNALGIPPGTPISVRLQQPVDSGHAHNGDTVRGVLATVLGKVPSGAPVSLTVVAAAPAGQLSSNGTLSLQVVSINGEQVLSQVVTAEGKEGQKVLADDAPARGTEAIFTADQPITLPAA